MAPGGGYICPMKAANLTLCGVLLTGALAVALPAPASADYDTAGYVNALEQAGLMMHGPGGDPFSQFEDIGSAVWTGMSVCRSVAQGQSRDSIVYGLNHGEGMQMSYVGAVAIYDAATTYLC